MNDFSIVLSVLALALSVAAALFAARAAARALALQDQLTHWLASPPTSRSESDSIVSARLSELEETMAVLANRVKMSRVRTAATHAEKPSSDLPDPHTDPDGWRTAMNKKLAAARLPR
jgi:hypothetical protein